MTFETLVWLRGLVAAQQISVGAPDFSETVQMVIKVLAELDEAIQAQAG